MADPSGSARRTRSSSNTASYGGKPGYHRGGKVTVGSGLKLSEKKTTTSRPQKRTSSDISSDYSDEPVIIFEGPRTNEPQKKKPATEGTAMESKAKNSTFSYVTSFYLPSMESKAKNSTFSKPQQLVTVNVGKGNSMQSFQLHKDWLCQHSKFFDSAFNGKFLEGESQVMNLEDDEPEVFGLFVQWIYTKTLSDDSVDDSVVVPDVFRLFKLWALADMLNMIPLQNAIIKAIYQKKYAFGFNSYFNNCHCEDLHQSAFYPTKDELEVQLRFLYDHTMPGSSLRRLMVYALVKKAQFIHDLSFENFEDVLPKEMLWDAMVYLAKAKPGKVDMEVEDFLMKED